MKKIVFTALTDIGKKYQINEDSYVLPKQEDKEKLFVLCDGVGGSRAGEVASKLTCQWIYENRIVKGNSLTESIQMVNKKLFELAQKHPEYSGMCTTLVCGLFILNTLKIYSFGDSRAYLFRKNSLKQITEDDSTVWKLYKNGLISKDSLRFHPNNNIITQALGSTKNLKKKNSYKIRIKVKDIFLFCSDGLTDMVPDGMIKEILQKKIPLEQKAKELIKKANDAGGKDNITVIIVEVG